MDGLSAIQLPSLNMETLHVRNTNDLFSHKSGEANPHSCCYKGKNIKYYEKGNNPTKI